MLYYLNLSKVELSKSYSRLTWYHCYRDFNPGPPPGRKLPDCRINFSTFANPGREPGNITMNTMAKTVRLSTLFLAILALSACSAWIFNLSPDPPASRSPAVGATPSQPPAPSPRPPTPTRRPTAVSLTTPTPQPGGLDGVVFFDRDGDGLQGEADAGVVGAQVCIPQAPESPCAVTDSRGRYVLVGIPPSGYDVYIVSPSDEPALAFRYVNVFKGWREVPAYLSGRVWVEKQRLPETALQSIQKPLEVDVQPGARLDIALTQGFLTDIFTCSDRQKVKTYQAFDLDPRQGFVRNYDESQSRDIQRGANVLNGDNHFAYDWGEVNHNVIGIPLYAPANGMVTFAGEGETWNGLCRLVNLVHPEVGASTGLVHLDTVLVKDGWQVLRGQLLGTLGQNCTTWPHVHFFFRPSRSTQGGSWEGSDPYRDIANSDSFSYWTVDNQPQCLDK
jgi:hypothetical protein